MDVVVVTLPAFEVGPEESQGVFDFLDNVVSFVGECLRGISSVVLVAWAVFYIAI